MSRRTALAAYHVGAIWRDPRAWGFMLLVALTLSVMTVLFSLTAEPDLLGKNAMLQRMVQIIIVFGLGAAALQAADSFSGERERGTLESWILAPVAPWDHVLAKAAAAGTWWVAALAVGIPYAWVLSVDGAGFVAALITMIVGGTLLVGFGVAIGLMVSLRAHDNRRSMAATLGVILAAFGPAFVPRLDQLAAGRWLIRADPAAAVLAMVDDVLVKGYSVMDSVFWLAGPVLVAGAVWWWTWRRGQRLCLDPGVRH